MTKLQAINKSIAHWKRMIKWVTNQQRTAEPSLLAINSSIHEGWLDDDCALCTLYSPTSCDGCPIYELDRDCNMPGSAWRRVDLATTWGVWLRAADGMLTLLEECKHQLKAGKL